MMNGYLLKQVIVAILLLSATVLLVPTSNAETVGVSEYIFTSGASGEGSKTFLTGDTALVEWDVLLDIDILGSTEVLGITVNFFGIEGATAIIGNDSGSDCDVSADDFIWSACYSIVSNDGPLTDKIASVNALLPGNGNPFNITFLDVEIFNVNTPAAIPIPAAIWLFGTALLGLVGFSKRRKAA